MSGSGPSSEKCAVACKLLWARLEANVDQVFFAFKRAHHAALNFARPILREFDLTPARFDIIVATTIDPTQTGVRRILGLGRAAISEMLGRLEELGIVKREKLGRTRRIVLTAKGRAIFEKAHRACIETRKVAQTIDGLLTLERDATKCRSVLAAVTTLVRGIFRDGATRILYEGNRDADVLFAA